MRVLKPSGSLFYNHKDILKDNLTIAPTFIYDYPLHQQIIWDRGSSCTLDNHYFIPSNEWIYWIVKDPKAFKFHRQESLFMTNSWRMSPKKDTEHPAPFPEKLVVQCLLSCTDEGDLVLDPFMGSGTTAMVATKMKRHYLGFDISPNYVQLSNDRLNEENSKIKLF